jgi:RNA ligase (TIGR02306 family)
MSSLIVEVCEIQEVSPCPDADRLQIVHVKGWQVVTGVATVKVGDKVVYVPPDSILNAEVATKWGVLQYLKQLPKDQFGNRPEGGRVGVAKLRGQYSYGFITPVEDPNWPVGYDVAAHYGITKYEPPPEAVDGDSAPTLSTFQKYTNIENIRNFPDVFEPGEMVVITEKIHGKNSRVGLVRDQDEYSWAAGSHGVRRKEFNAKDQKSEFWEPLTDNMKALLEEVSEGRTKSVMAFGEIFGSGVQDMVYGMVNGKRSYRLFDISVDGIYLGYERKTDLCKKHGIEMVPILYCGPYTPEIVARFTSGDTVVCNAQEAGKFTFREGVIITPVKERTHFKIGRVILKSISPEYLMRKGDTTEHR